MQYSFGISESGTIVDKHKRELPDDRAARVEALRFATQILSEAKLDEGGRRDLTVEANGADHAPLFTVQISLLDTRQPGNPDDESEGHPS